MPTIKIQQTRFNKLMDHEYDIDKLEELGFEFGIEIEEDSEPSQSGEIKYFRFECTNNRPDLLSEPSLVRTLRMYLGKTPCPQIQALTPVHKIIVEPSVNQIRPYVVGAVLRDVTFTPETYKSFIDFQDKLHVTLCRNRTLVSMGTHNLDSIQGPFHYKAKDPKSFKFAPLNHAEEMDGHKVMEILESHKLKEYLPIIRDSPVYPLILDAKDRVCSLPPIINSEHSKMSVETKNVLIEITATSKPKALVCLNTLIWGFSEFCAKPFTVESVEIQYEDHKEITPVWEEKSFTVLHSNAEKLVGSTITEEKVIEYLGRMGLVAQKLPGDMGKYNVRVPAWRSDVLHECDILEDIAICFGFQNIQPRLPPSQTIGSQLRINKFTDLLRIELASAQYNEALNFALCSKAEMTKMICSDDESKLITLGLAKTRQFQTGRISLIPGLLKTVVENRANSLPYKFFEVGDCIIKTIETDTGAKNERKLAVLITDEVTKEKNKGLFSVIHGTFDLLMSKLRLSKAYKLGPSNESIYFSSQQAEILLDGKRLGSLGIIHPRVLGHFGWTHPVSAFEVDLELLESKFFA